ncbi:MAG TPA: single-stranded DNA-binding protein [Candidatus Paceibacterota bacterium]|jgi:single-strand DNA-binding protein|nr:single-stranded DNA-binding protein [Candidatus Paceibacterota bacterium]
MYLNKAILIGNLTRDPELKSLPSGIQVASFSIATNRVWRDKNGAKQESADYHNIVVFGRQAETVSRYLKKGSSVLVEGRMQTRSWDAQDGSKKYRTEIIAERVQFGPRREGEGNYGGGAPKAASGADHQADAPMGDEGGAVDYPDEINPDEIPF